MREVDVRAGALCAELPLLSVSQYRGVVPRSELTEKEPRAEDLSNYKRCWPGDIVLNRMSAYQGALGIAGHTGIVSPDYAVLRAGTALDSRFLTYLMKSHWFVAEMTMRLRGIGTPGGSSVRTPRVNIEDLGEIRLNVPPLDEQKRIADFLDSQIAAASSIIQLRESQRAALASVGLHALSDAARGLWPDASTGAVPWFPIDRPGWKLLRVSWISKCLDGRRVPLSGEVRLSRKGEYPYYGASAIVDWIDDFLFDEELVLVGEDGGALSNPEFDVIQEIAGKTWVNNHAHVLRATEVETSYLAAILRCVDRPLLVSGSTRPKITQDDLMSLRVPVPPEDERALIVEAAQEIRNDIAARSESLGRSIDLLNEYKRSLITAAVTGEFDVSSASGRGIPA